MGLDMYLTARRYLGSWDEKDKAVKKRLSSMAYFKGLDVQEVIVSVGYWRKANHIHKWFVDYCQEGVDECQETYVEADKLIALKKSCEEILENHKLGKEKLPTTGGFFFGSTDYDEYYFKDLEETVEIIKKALAMDNRKWTFYYHSSW
jgi:hypothetical protein